jgi:hypothetical protein
LTSCAVAGAPSPVEVTFDTPFPLAVGATAVLESAHLQVRFEDVTADSRCPKGEQCITEGDAVVRIAAKQGSDAEEMFELHTSPKATQAVAVGDHGVRLVRLDPPPVSGRQTDRAAYVATLEITREVPEGAAAIR